MSFPLRFTPLLVALGLISRLVLAQSGDELRGAGAYLNGLGWYNLNTAKANAINVDTVIRWKTDLRKIQSDRRIEDAQARLKLKGKVDEARKKQALREIQLRTDPSAADVYSGDALDVLLYDLTDPSISQGVWDLKPVPLPEGMSLKDMIFRFTPISGTSQSSVALGRGVIALSRLDLEGKWPITLNEVELANSRRVFEIAYSQVKDEVIRGNLKLKSVLEMDAALDGLKLKANQVLPLQRGYRAEAVRFIDDLRDATRMFDATTVDYAKEILIDTKDHDAATVGQLVGFMSKYRLQFASAEKHPATRELYSKLYSVMKQQIDDFGIAPPTVPSGPSPSAAVENVSPLINPDFANGLAGWKTSGSYNDFRTYNNGVHTFGIKTKEAAKGRVAQSFKLPENAALLRFEIGGGKRAVHVALLENGKAVHKAAGKNSNSRHIVQWDVRSLAGKTVELEIVDNGGGAWEFIHAERFAVEYVK